MTEPIELSGIGEVYAGTELLRRTRYHLEVSTRTGAEGAEPRIEGTVDIAGMGEAVVLAGAQELTLRLEDGRRLAFTLTSTTGRIRVHGGFQAAG
jgi:hypothetical protein